MTINGIWLNTEEKQAMPTPDRRVALIALKDAAEAGTLDPQTIGAIDEAFDWDGNAVTMTALWRIVDENDMNAALALLGAVLPGVQWAIYSRSPFFVVSLAVTDTEGYPEEIYEHSRTPARALLLAILTALIEMEAQP